MELLETDDVEEVRRELARRGVKESVRDADHGGLCPAWQKIWTTSLLSTLDVGSR